MTDATQPTLQDADFKQLVQDNVSDIVRDKDLRSLKHDSEEFRTAVTKKYYNAPEVTNETQSASEPDDSKKNSGKEKGGANGKASDADGDTDKDDSKFSAQAQKRIGRLTALKKSAQTELETARARIAELEKRSTKPAADGDTSAKKDDAQRTESTSGDGFKKPEPNLEDFDGKDYGTYYRALAKWEAEKSLFEYQQAQAYKARETEVHGKIGAFFTKGAEIETDLGLGAGEFAEIVGNPEFKLTQPGHELLMTSEHGPRIAVEIANDDDLREKFSKMDAVKQVALIGKLEGKIEAEQEAASSNKNGKKATGAKKPATDLRAGKSSGISPPTPVKNGQLSMDDYRKWRKDNK